MAAPGEVHIGCDGARLHAGSRDRTTPGVLTTEQTGLGMTWEWHGTSRPARGLARWSHRRSVMPKIPLEIRALAVLLAAVLGAVLVEGGVVSAQGTGKWSKGAPMPSERTEVAVAEVQGKIYV